MTKSPKIFGQFFIFCYSLPFCFQFQLKSDLYPIINFSNKISTFSESMTSSHVIMAADQHLPPDILVSFCIFCFYNIYTLFLQNIFLVPYGVNKMQIFPTLLGADWPNPPKCLVSFWFFIVIVFWWINFEKLNLVLMG